MSGISRGSIFFTPVVMALSVMNTAENIAKTAGKIAFAGAIAVHRYNKKQEEKKVKKLSDDIEKLDKSVTETLNVQREELYRTIENVLDEMSEVQNIISENIDSSDGEAFRNLLRETGKNTVSSIEKIHSRFKKCYDEAVNRSNSEISSALTSLKEKVAEEIKNAESDIAAREKRAAERAQSLINDARKLSSAFNSEAGEKYITEAEYDVMKGNYQSAVSLASSAITQIYMDMYRSDAEEKERDFYRSSLVYFSAEIKELLDSLHSVEFRMSEESDEILSADLTQFMKCEYEEFCRKSEESERFISEDAENADSIELHKRSDELGKLLAEIKEEMADAFYFMLYSLNRVEAEKSIYGILKEKGFTLTDTKYTDGDPSKAGERTYSCPLTGEEITISLIPYTDEDNEIKTELVVLSSESSEESREQYRKDIVNSLQKSCSSIDSVSLKCMENTRNMNAGEAGVKTAIENPQLVRRR